MRTALGVLLLGAVCAGCGGGSPAGSRSPPAPPRDRVAVRLERALRRNPNDAASAASCRLATRSERTSAPFGRTRDREFACSIALGGPAERYVVQVLPSGCFVAERVRRGRADYGCLD